MTNLMTVTGRILNLEEKKSTSGPFYMVDLETFYGPNIRFQAWNDAYEFIKKNQLRAANEAGIGGDYLDVIGYTHTYMLENKNGGKNQYVTFKTKNVKRPTARVTYSGKALGFGNEKIDVLTDQVGFLFIPDTPCFDEGKWRPANAIQCVMDKSNPDYSNYLKLEEKNNYFLKQRTAVVPLLSATISGAVDNTNKKLTKILVDSLTLEEEDDNTDK